MLIGVGATGTGVSLTASSLPPQPLKKVIGRMIDANRWRRLDFNMDVLRQQKIEMEKSVKAQKYKTLIVSSFDDGDVTIRSALAERHNTSDRI
jgi:hypothetical protein